MQDRAKVITISLSALGQSQLYPWKDLKAIVASRSLSQDLPLFQVPLLAGAVPLTDSVARKHLKDISRLLGFQKPFTFHDFRLSGMGFPSRIYRTRGTGLLHVSRDIFSFFRSFPCGCLFLCAPFYMTTLYWVLGDLVFALSPVCLMLSNYICYRIDLVIVRIGI